MSASDYRRISHDDHEARDHIPIIWIRNVEENNENDPLRHACNSIRVTNESDHETETIDTTWVNGNSNVQQETNTGKHEKNRGRGHSAVPETPSATWNELEKDSFILGLYIFGKKFAHVKNLVGTKNMNDIQSFYYGKFYKSDAYRRWHECKKMRSRKCINYGQKIFTGERQEELFSRLLQNISVKCIDKLHKVNQKFVEEEMNLQEYVFTLKDAVGLKALVEAVGIHRGKTVSTNASKSTNGKGVSPDMIGTENNSSKQVVSTGNIGSTNPSAASKHKKIDLLSNVVRREAMRSQSFQRVEPDITNFVFPVAKRGRRSNSFSCVDRDFNINSSRIFMVLGGKPDKSSSIPDKSKPFKNSDANISKDPRERKEKATNPLLKSNFTDNVIQQETLADPLHVPFSNISKEAVDVASSSGTEDQHEGKEEEHDTKARRKSRRSQQPTIKGLEALANGYLDINARRKRKLRLQDNLMPMPRTSRSTRPRVAGETSHNGVPMLPDFRNEGRINVGCDASGHGNGKASVTCAGFKSSGGHRWPSFRVPGSPAMK